METKTLTWEDNPLPKKGSVLRDMFGVRYKVLQVQKKERLVTLEEVATTQ